MRGSRTVRQAGPFVLPLLLAALTAARPEVAPYPFTTISPNLGVYANEPEADPVAEWLASCQRFTEFASEDHFVLGGHKLPFKGLPTRLRQLADNHIGALGRLVDHLEEPKRGGECFLPLFKREIGSGEYGMALAETIAHLNHLHQTGRARRWRGEDGAYRWQAV